MKNTCLQKVTWGAFSRLSNKITFFHHDIYFIKQSKIASFFFVAFKNPTSKNAVLTLLLN